MKDLTKNLMQDLTKNLMKDPIKNLMKDPIKNLMKDLAKNLTKDLTKNLMKDQFGPAKTLLTTTDQVRSHVKQEWKLVRKYALCSRVLEWGVWK